MLKNKLYLWYFVLVLSSLIFFQQASAQSLGIDPLLVQRTITAGSSVNFTINIQNDSLFEAVTLQVGVADLSENIRGVYDLVDPKTSAFSLADWVSFQPEVLTIQPASSGSVLVTISVPRGISGGRYGAITLIPPKDSHQSAVGDSTTPFTYRMASFIELEIGSVARKEAFISDFAVALSEDWPTIRQQVGDHALVYSAEVTNVSNVHITTKGTLSIRTPEGRTIANYPLGGGRGIILPESTVRLQSVTSLNLSPGDYIARAVIDYGGRRPMVSEVEFAVTASDLAAKEQVSASLSRFIVEPEEIELVLRAGAMGSTIIELTNRGSEAISVVSKIIPLEFSLLGDFLPEEDRGAGPDWISLSPASFVLQPGRSQKARLTLRPPKGLTGGHYVDLVFESSTEGGSVEAGSSILLFVGDKIARNGSIEIVNIEQELEQIVFDAMFTNIGNYHLIVGGDFSLSKVYERYIDEETGQVFPRRTEVISSIAIPTSTNPVLPGRQRAFSFQIPTALEVGDYEIAIRVDYGGDEPALTLLPFGIEKED